MRHIRITKTHNIVGDQRTEVKNETEHGIEYTHPYIGGHYDLFPFDGTSQGISTPLVAKIIDENTFETKGSVYKIEEISDVLNK